MDEECIFCKIATGELPSTKVYEDSEILAFMDIGPVVKGHTLVIPRQHIDPITSIPAELLQKLILVVQKVAGAQMAGLKADGLNITQANGKVAGQIVPHAHFHVIPRFDTDGYSFKWRPGKYENSDEMAGYAEKIRNAL